MYVQLITLTALVASVACHDVTVGLQNGGRKVYDENITASPAIWRQVQTVFVAATEGEFIGRIAIKDNRPDKNGEVRITEGGVGQKNVTIELKSPTVFRGLDFSVDVYTISEDEYLKNETETPAATIDDDIKINVNNTEKPEQSSEKVTVKSTNKVPEPHKDEEVVPAIAGKDHIDIKTSHEGSGDSNLKKMIDTVFPSTTTSGPIIEVPTNPTVIKQVVTENLPNNSPVPKEPVMQTLPVVPAVGNTQ